VTGLHQRDEILRVLAGGDVIAVPDVGGYALALAADHPDAWSRLSALASTNQGDPTVLVGSDEQARALAATWTETAQQVTDRCWPGPLTILLTPMDEARPFGGAPDVIGVRMPLPRSIRHLVRDSGPWLVSPLGLSSAAEVDSARAQADLALVVDGGRCTGPGPTVVDVTGPRFFVRHEGVLPTAFIEGAMLMGRRRRWFRRASSPLSDDGVAR
jgi:L-threonylcarbamoyladenylate synthase